MGNFGDWVKLKRKQQGITLKELDALTGVSYGAISDWERGRRTPHRDTAVRVAEALHGDPREALEALMADTLGTEHHLQPQGELEHRAAAAFGKLSAEEQESFLLLIERVAGINRDKG